MALFTCTIPNPKFYFFGFLFSKKYILIVVAFNYTNCKRICFKYCEPIRIYFCSVKAEQSFELQPDGEPVVFDLSLEVGKPPSGPMVELINYETRKKLEKGENGFYYEIDGSTEVLSE